MSSIVEFDHWLFSKVNHDWTNGFFDWLFPSITDFNQSPIIFLFVLPLLSFWIFKKRAQAVRWLVVLIVCVGLTDLISYRLIKSAVGRDRPEFAGLTVQLRTGSRSGSSFPSNHASNIFAGATVMSGAFPVLTPVFYLFAFLIAYSRVYVGVHFPLDVTAGAVLGILIALSIRKLLTKWTNQL